MYDIFATFAFINQFILQKSPIHPSLAWQKMCVLRQPINIFANESQKQKFFMACFRCHRSYGSKVMNWLEHIILSQKTKLCFLALNMFCVIFFLVEEIKEQLSFLNFSIMHFWQAILCLEWKHVFQ